MTHHNQASSNASAPDSYIDTPNSTQKKPPPKTTKHTHSKKETRMPTLTIFHGIVISMHPEKGSKHHVPHIHAQYAEHNASVSIADSTVVKGSLPENKMCLVKAWIEIHREDIMANWTQLQKGEEWFRIEPLR
jgi:hypothetical protein